MQNADLYKNCNFIVHFLIFSAIISPIVRFGGIDVKKPYSKPTLTFQNMFLATGVSMGCTFTSTYAYDSCVTFLDDWGGETIFDSDGVHCDWGYQTFPCYDVPMESSNVFES